MIPLSLLRSAGAEPIVLPPLTVEASPLDRYLPAQTEVGRDEIVDAHKNELGDVLDLTPGVNVRDGGRREVRIDVRGLDQRAVLFTLNGVPIYEPWNGIINMNLFPLEMLDAIVVDRGPSSTLFGPNGMGGTVKLTTARPHGPVSASASTIWHDSDTWDARASGGLAAAGVAGLLGGRYVTTPGFPLPGDFNDLPTSRRRWENGGLRRNSDAEQKNAFADLGYEYSEDGRAHVTFLGSDASFGIPPSTTAFLGPFLRSDREDLWHVQADVEQRLTPSLTAAAATYYTAYDIKQTQFDSAELTRELVTTHADSQDIGGLARLTAAVAEADSLAVAMQARYDDAHVFDDANGPHARPYFVTTTVAAENVYQLRERVSLVAGASLDMQDGKHRTRTEFDPQGGIAVDFGAFGTSRAGISRKIRFPTLRELYDPMQGNSRLRPEVAIIYEVGHRVQTSLGYAALNLFRSDVSNLIDNVGDDNTFVNSQHAALQGVEVAVGGMPMPLVRVDINYTYLNTRASNPTASGGSESDVQHRPEHRFNGILRIFLPLELTLRLEGLYTSDQLDRFGSDVTVDAYTLFNLQLIERVTDRLQVFAGVDNILDNEHEDKLGAPGPGRWAFAGLRLSYD